VFYNGTCTALESVYVRVFGDINVTQDTLTTSQIENLMVDGMSLALNLPKDFIIILIIQSVTTTAAISTTPRPTATPRPTTSTTSTTSAVRTTTTPIPHNSSNSTHTGRRLLNVPTQLILFESYIRAITLNQLEKVELGLSATANMSSLLKEATGLKVTFGRRESVQGFVNSDGSPFSCPGGFPMPNTTTGLLDCIPYATPPPPEPANNTALVATVVVVLLVMAGIGVYKYTSLHKYKPVPTQKPPQTTETASKSTSAPTTQGSFLQSFYRSANLQFPATVAIEYHVVPGQSM
jgi:hypothetical protein